MKIRLLPVVLGVALAAPGAVFAAPSDGRTAIEPWIELELGAIASHSLPPPRASRALALVSVAMDRAARKAERDERRAAVDAAASTVLAYLFPDLSGLIRGLAHRSEDDKGDNRDGASLGRRIGQKLIARARTDGADAVWTGTVPTGPGLWQPTPPSFLPPLLPLWGSVRTWNLASGSQFQPGPPPAFGGAQFAAELAEVYAVSQSLTLEQRAIALYWSDGAGTVTPPGHWNRIALDLIRDHPLSTAAAARVLAALNTAQADAFIACWDAKYAYWSIRPVTVIQLLLNPAWSSLIVTPPFPSYVSGHSTTSGAASTVLAHFFPDRAMQLAAMAEEAAVSRLYGGIHFRSDNEVGLTLGRKIGAVAVDVYGEDSTEEEESDDSAAATRARPIASGTGW